MPDLLVPSPGRVARELERAGFRAQIPLVNTLLRGMTHIAEKVTEALTELLGVNLDRNEDFSFLPLDDGAVRVNTGVANQQAVATVGTEGDYVAVGILCQADDRATPPVLLENAFTAEIRDGSTGRDFMRNPVPQGFLGTGVVGRPASAGMISLAKPRFYSRSGQVFWRFTNVQGADIDINAAFWGYRILDPNQLDLTKTR